MKSAGKARSNGLYRHIRTSKEIIRNLLNDSIYEILLKIFHGSGKIFLCLFHSVPLRGRGRAQNRKDAKIAASFPWVGFTAHTLAGGDV